MSTFHIRLKLWKQVASFSVVSLIQRAQRQPEIDGMGPINLLFLMWHLFVDMCTSTLQFSILFFFFLYVLMEPLREEFATYCICGIMIVLIVETFLVRPQVWVLLILTFYENWVGLSCNKYVVFGFLNPFTCMLRLIISAPSNGIV